MVASGGWGRLRGDSEAVGIAWLLLSSLLVAFLPNTAKLAYAGCANAATLLLLRGFIGVGLLGLGLVLSGKTMTLPRRLILPSLLAGAGAAGFVYGFYNAILTLEVGLAMLIVYIYPVLIGLYEHVLGRMRIGVSRTPSDCERFQSNHSIDNARFSILTTAFIRAIRLIRSADASPYSFYLVWESCCAAKTTNCDSHLERPAGPDRVCAGRRVSRRRQRAGDGVQHPVSRPVGFGRGRHPTGRVGPDRVR